MEKIIPNTTQVPNIVLDEWMPRLKDTELRCLLVISRQTLGWLEDAETGRRKEKDWISQHQLMEKTHRSNKAVSEAMKKLIDELHIVEAFDGHGNALETPALRRQHGGKIYYRLALRAPDSGLFGTHVETSYPVDKPVENRGGYVKSSYEKSTHYKRNSLTKEDPLDQKKPEVVTRPIRLSDSNIVRLVKFSAVTGEPLEPLPEGRYQFLDHVESG